MAAIGVQPEQGSPVGAASADIEAGVVDALDGCSRLRSERVRHLLLNMVERRSGVSLQVPDYPTARQWFFGLLDVCREHPDGLEALAAAVADLEPASSAVVAVRRLSVGWDAGVGSDAGAGWDAGVGSDAGAGPDAGAAWSAADPPSGPAVVAGGLTRPREPERLSLSDAELRELAQVFHQATAARQLLAAAGLPPGRQPTWSDMSPLEFWGEVSHMLAAGVLHDGRRCVLAAAAVLYPANPVFTD